MKKVCLFTTFYEVDSGFSLVSVVETQLQMLLDNGYDPLVLVEERFGKTDKELWQVEQIDLRPIVPQPEKDYKEFLNMLRGLPPLDVIITHDLILHLQFYAKHDKALRQYAKENPHILWLHYIHSRPTANYEPPPGWIIYPNWTDKPQVTNCYKTDRVVTNRSSHSIDPLKIWPYDPLTVDLVKKSNLLAGDITAIYPRGGDSGKQTDKIIRLMAGVKNAGYTPKLLIVDWQSQGGKFQNYMDKMEILAEELGLSENVYFTSRLDDRCSQGIPRKNVIELLNLTNVYIHSSKAETYGLVPHEAMLQGNLVCLNWDWQVMAELFGDNAIYFDFGSVTIDRTYKPDEQTFWNDEARRLINEYKKNRALVAQTEARQKWTPQALWQDFEGLLHLETFQDVLKPKEGKSFPLTDRVG